MGDHTETVQIDYESEQIHYEELIEMFWEMHDPTVRCGGQSQQYASKIFFHNEAQREVAEESKKKREEIVGCKLFTSIEPFVSFHKAEGYHQHYIAKQGEGGCNVM
mmetsp:Transcript_8167/g.34318  ORF Transcript_8167/g.34318 Transcript_8167/m.34318 type:complete len:106 (-) Transcript_8167:154-471(-)